MHDDWGNPWVAIHFWMRQFFRVRRRTAKMGRSRIWTVTDVWWLMVFLPPKKWVRGIPRWKSVGFVFWVFFLDGHGQEILLEQLESFGCLGATLVPQRCGVAMGLPWAWDLSHLLWIFDRNISGDYNIIIGRNPGKTLKDSKILTLPRKSHQV